MSTPGVLTPGVVEAVVSAGSALSPASSPVQPVNASSEASHKE